MTFPARGERLPRSAYGARQLAESERIHREWLNGQSTDPGAYDDVPEVPPVVHAQE